MIAVVIEDEPFVLAVFKAILEMRGFLVLPGHDAEAGFRWFVDGGRRIDLVIVDRCLPGTSALRMVSEIRAAQPHVLMLFTSATPMEYWDETDLRYVTSIPENCYAFLQKPFTAQKLIATVDELIGRRTVLAQGSIG